MEMAGGSFYVDAQREVVVDPFVPPQAQNQLLDALRRCDNLVQRDLRYAHLVAGASKMPMNMIWAVRNQEELVNDADLATFKDIAWTEFIKKRFLSSIPENTTVSTTAASMLEIVRDMNLQRRRFQIMGLHEQVEASEIQLVLHLCQANIINTNQYRVMANRFRRDDRFYEAFALAVGAFVCAQAPFTLGAATTRYERDLQYEYKKHTTALFVYVLRKNPGPSDPALDEDYVARIAKLIVLWPGGGDHRQVPRRGGDDDSSDGDDGDLKNAILYAQTHTDRVENEVKRLDDKWNKEFENGVGRVTDRFNDLQRQFTNFDASTRVEMGRLDTSVQTRISDFQNSIGSLVLGVLSTDPGKNGKTYVDMFMDSVMSAIDERMKGIEQHLGTLTERVGESDVVMTDAGAFENLTEGCSTLFRDLGELKKDTSASLVVLNGLITTNAQGISGLLADLTHLKSLVDLNTTTLLGLNAHLPTIDTVNSKLVELSALVTSNAEKCEELEGTLESSVDTLNGGIATLTASVQIIRDKNNTLKRIVENSLTQLKDLSDICEGIIENEKTQMTDSERKIDEALSQHERQMEKKWRAELRIVSDRFEEMRDMDPEEHSPDVGMNTADSPSAEINTDNPHREDSGGENAEPRPQTNTMRVLKRTRDDSQGEDPRKKRPASAPIVRIAYSHENITDLINRATAAATYQLTARLQAAEESTRAASALATAYEQRIRILEQRAEADYDGREALPENAFVGGPRPT
jgi:hypothetical protein